MSGSPFSPNNDPFKTQGQKPDLSAAFGKFKKTFSFGSKLFIAALLLVIIGFSSVYMLNTSDEAVITRFGRYVATIDDPGLQFKLPFVDRASVVNVSSIRRLEFGYRTNDPETGVKARDVEEEATMITGDLNIVIADWAILYKIKNSYDYLFNVDSPVETLRIISESTYRRVVASHTLDHLLTDQKDIIQAEIMIDLQSICDKYGLGIQITSVQLQDAMPPNAVNPSFIDVTNAKEEKEAKINEASKYENEQLPVARGEAQKLLNDAEAYKQKRINEAEGDVARYSSIEAQYSLNPGITRTRLYIEMIREVLPKIKNVYIVDDSGNTLKFLPIGQDAGITASGN